MDQQQYQQHYPYCQAKECEVSQIIARVDKLHSDLKTEQEKLQGHLTTLLHNLKHSQETHAIHLNYNKDNILNRLITISQSIDRHSQTQGQIMKELEDIKARKQRPKLQNLLAGLGNLKPTLMIIFMVVMGISTGAIDLKLAASIFSLIKQLSF